MIASGTWAAQGTARLWSVAALGFLACLASVAYAAISGHVLQGGRGGVFALMLTFGMLFLDRGTETDYLEIDVTAAAESDLEAVKALNVQNRNALATMIDWNNKHKRPLAVLSIAGTFFAGYGDLTATWLRALFV